MGDQVFMRFLQNSLIEAMELADPSDCLRLTPIPPLLPSSYLLAFDVQYLRRLPSGVVEVAARPVLAGLHFPPGYLRGGQGHLSMTLASMLTPDIVHPNISRAGTVCLGRHFAAGTPIAEVLWHLHEIVSYRALVVDERDAFNPEACRLLRERPDLLERLPYRPLRRARRALAARVEHRLNDLASLLGKPPTQLASEGRRSPRMVASCDTAAFLMATTSGCSGSTNAAAAA